MGDCGSFAVIEGQGISKNLQGRGNRTDPSSFQYQNNRDSHKEQSKQRNILGSGLPLLGEGDFHCGAEIMTSGF